MRPAACWAVPDSRLDPIDNPLYWLRVFAVKRRCNKGVVKDIAEALLNFAPNSNPPAEKFILGVDIRQLTIDDL